MMRAMAGTMALVAVAGCGDGADRRFEWSLDKMTGAPSIAIGGGAAKPPETELAPVAAFYSGQFGGDSVKVVEPRIVYGKQQLYLESGPGGPGWTMVGFTLTEPFSQLSMGKAHSAPIVHCWQNGQTHGEANSPGSITPEERSDQMVRYRFAVKSDKGDVTGWIDLR